MSDINVNKLNPKVVLGIVAHPDDLDFSSSGSFAVWASQGAEVYYLILTDGSKGSSDEKISSEQLIKIREEEQRNAAKILGAKDVFFLHHPDAMLEITMDIKKEVCRYIRKIKPDVVITMDPTVLYSLQRGFINHPDHRAAGQIAVDCVFPLSRDRLTFPELLKEGYEPHKVATLLLVNFDNPNFYVDISESIDKKMAALAEHRSQIADVEVTSQMIKQWAEAIGGKAGVGYAEGFLRLDVMG